MVTMGSNSRSICRRRLTLSRWWRMWTITRRRLTWSSWRMILSSYCHCGPVTLGGRSSWGRGTPAAMVRPAVQLGVLEAEVVMNRGSVISVVWRLLQRSAVGLLHSSVSETNTTKSIKSALSLFHYNARCILLFSRGSTVLIVITLKNFIYGNK